MGGLVLSRRRFLIGGAALVAAPAIVSASSLMPVRPVFELARPLGGVVTPFNSISATALRYWEQKILRAAMASPTLQALCSEVDAHG